MAEEDRNIVGHVFRGSAAKHHSWNIEYRLIAKDGRPIWMNEVGAAIFNGSGVLRFIEGTVLNIDSKKQADAQRAAVVAAAAQASEAIVTATQSIFKLLSDLQILALNAQIEASRAGQLGAGFNVVAQEIKLLANEANLSASEITEATDRLRRAYADASGDDRS